MASDTPAPMSTEEIEERRENLRKRAKRFPGIAAIAPLPGDRVLATLDAKDAEIARLRENRDLYLHRAHVSEEDMRDAERRATAAEARLAEAVKALERYRSAVRIDVTMEGPRFMGVEASALKRAWEADRAFLDKGGSDAG